MGQGFDLGLVLGHSLKQSNEIVSAKLEGVDYFVLGFVIIFIISFFIFVKNYKG